MVPITVRGQRSGIRSGLQKQGGGYYAYSILAGECFSMSNSSCGRTRAVKANKQSGCGTEGASRQLASAETYATPSTKELRQVIKDDDIVLAYVVRTCQSVHAGAASRSPLLQHVGSGPNIDGGRITLCTCKHRMRASPVFEDENLKSRIWIAGFSSSRGGEENWLFYLMKVAEVFASQQGIYERLKSDPNVLARKLASENVLGDIFEPMNPCRNPLNPDDYKKPHPEHRHRPDDLWRSDIKSEYYGRNPKMLLGDKKASYCYSVGRIKLNTKRMTQGYLRMSGEEFFHRLNDFPES